MVLFRSHTEVCSVLPQVAFKCGICFMSCTWLAACMMMDRGFELIPQVIGSIGLSDCCMHSQLWIYTFEHVTKTTTTQVSTGAFPFLRDLSSEDFMWAAEGAAHTGAAKRRRERRHRAYLKFVRMSVAMALSEYKHHTSRGQRMDRAGVWGRELNYTATIRDPSSPLLLPSTHTHQLEPFSLLVYIFLVYILSVSYELPSGPKDS